MKVVPPERYSRFVNSEGTIVDDRIHRFHEMLAEQINDSQPSYVEISNSDSPYAATTEQYIVVDMSGGDVTITLPSTGRLYIKREGASNTLTLTGDVDGTTNPTVAGDGTVVRLAYVVDEYKEF